jgi:hypothetical protein
MTGADREIAGEFVRLSREAQKERSTERLIDLLMERGRLISDAQTSGRQLDLPLDELKECLEREVKLLSRLEYERHKLLTRMEDLSKSMHVVHKYRAKFPFPPMPVFFDTTT